MLCRKCSMVGMAAFLDIDAFTSRGSVHWPSSWCYPHKIRFAAACRAGWTSREQQATPELITVTHGPAAGTPRRHRVPRAAKTFPPSSLRPRSLQAPLPALLESALPQRQRGGSLGAVGTAIAASAASAFTAGGDSLKEHASRTVHARSMPPQSAANSLVPPPPDAELGNDPEVAEPHMTRRASKVARRSRRSSQVGHQC